MFKDDFEFADGATPSHLHASPASGTDDSPARGDTMGGQRSGRSLTPFSSRAALALEAPEAASAVGFAEEEDEDATATVVAVTSTSWLAPAEAELKKIPFFVRGKARRNTEKYALEHGIAEITVDTLYDAKAYYGR
jgi:light-independent protochlorophyllide reductase subunit B